MGAEPAGCVVVEDTPSGVSAAVAANMRVFGYAADSDEQALRDAGATKILRSLDELPQIIFSSRITVKATVAMPSRIRARLR